MIKKYKTPCCPRCRYKYYNHEIDQLIVDDLQSVSCSYCKKLYYIVVKEDGYICFTNYYDYHNYMT